MARILLVDDNVDIRNFCKTLLEGHGYDVGSCADGSQALEILKEEEFDLIITDVAMPVMRGDELSVKAKALYPQLPIIMTSTQLPPRHQADIFLPKPYMIDNLLSAIDSLLAK